MATAPPTFSARSCWIRVLRSETIAISAPAKTPFAATSAKMIRSSVMATAPLCAARAG